MNVIVLVTTLLLAITTANESSHFLQASDSSSFEHIRQLKKGSKTKDSGSREHRKKDSIAKENRIVNIIPPDRTNAETHILENTSAEEALRSVEYTENDSSTGIINAALIIAGFAVVTAIGIAWRGYIQTKNLEDHLMCELERNELPRQDQSTLTINFELD